MDGPSRYSHTNGFEPRRLQLVKRAANHIHKYLFSPDLTNSCNLIMAEICLMTKDTHT